MRRCGAFLAVATVVEAAGIVSLATWTEQNTFSAWGGVLLFVAEALLVGIYSLYISYVECTRSCREF